MHNNYARRWASSLRVGERYVVAAAWVPEGDVPRAAVEAVDAVAAALYAPGGVRAQLRELRSAVAHGGMRGVAAEAASAVAAAADVAACDPEAMLVWAVARAHADEAKVRRAEDAVRMRSLSLEEGLALVLIGLRA